MPATTDEILAAVNALANTVNTLVTAVAAVNTTVTAVNTTLGAVNTTVGAVNTTLGVTNTRVNLALPAAAAGNTGGLALVGSAVTLNNTGFDAVLVEAGIAAGADLTDDAGAQLTAINARQALALAVSALGGVLSGAGTANVATKPAGKPAAASRIAAQVSTTAGQVGNRLSTTLKVPT